MQRPQAKQSGLTRLPFTIAGIARQGLSRMQRSQSVQIPGIGWFTLSLKGKLGEDERLVVESAKLKVNCRAEPDLAQDVNADQRFEYVGD